MSAVDRAAEVIARSDAHSERAPAYAVRLAQALADAGWHDGPKLTDADQAVLNAAEEWVDGCEEGCVCKFCRAVDTAVRARREAML